MLHNSCFLILAICATQIFGKSLFIIGGGLADENAQLWNRFIDMAGGDGVARIGIITAASADPLDSALYYQDMFTQYGALEAYWIPVHEGNLGANSDPVVVDNVNRMSGFFFGGGDQSRIITSLYFANRVESPVLTAMRQRYDSGASVVGGTSAGAAVVNTAVMVTGGASYEALLSGAFPSTGAANDLTYDPNGGLGFVDNMIVDSHTSERGREGRIIRLLSDTKDQAKGATVGCGVDEDTAFIITNVGEVSQSAEVLGEAGVYIADISNATPDDSGEHWTITNVRIFYLTEGDRIAFPSLSVTYAPWKSDMNGQEIYESAETSSDIFKGNSGISPGALPEFPYVATSIFDAINTFSTWGRTFEKKPTFRVDFLADAQTVGFGGTNPRTGRFDIAFNRLQVSIDFEV